MLSQKEILLEFELGIADPGRGLGVSPSPIYAKSKQIGPGSLDVRLGRWFLAIQQSKRSVIDLSKPEKVDDPRLDGKYFYVPFGEKFVIHPGRFVLGATLEWVRMPPHLGGYITGKSSLGRRGLIIETAAGIQPAFNGCLTLELFNCGEIPIAITPGMRVAQIFFHRISSESSVNNSDYNAHRKPLFGGYNLDHDLRQKDPRFL